MSFESWLMLTALLAIAALLALGGAVVANVRMLARDREARERAGICDQRRNGA